MKAGLPDRELELSWAVPDIGVEDAAAVLRQHWRLEGVLTPLPGERDRNFRLDTGSGQYVLKLANAQESRAVLELQHAAMARIAARDPALTVPRVVPSVDGHDLITVHAANGTAHLARLLTRLPGTPLATVKPRTLEQCRSLGEVLGRMDVALAEWDPAAARRTLKWDLARAGWIEAHWSRIADAERRSLARRLFRPYADHVAGRLDRIPASVIHNDANDHNVLVAERPGLSRPVVAVIDYGDIVRTATICELAIAIAYAMLDTPDPLAAAAAVVEGYHAARPLTEDELAALWPLACARLVVSVVNAALLQALEADNDYLQVSAAPVWALLERLAGVHRRFAEYRLRSAAGLPAHPLQPRFETWARENRDRFVPLLATTERGLPRVDLSVGSPFIDGGGGNDEPALTRRIAALLDASGARAGVGKHDEARLLYTSDAFRSIGWDGPEWRTVHLGIDVFAPPGTPVRAPLAGRVHSVQDHDAPLDYGPTVILRHTIDVAGDGPLGLFTLYGHLDRAVLERLRPGDAVNAGDTVGHIGSAAVNGGWSAHLHFQVVLDLLDHADTFPGVARPSERAVWCSLSPPPYDLAALPYASSAPTPGTDELLSQRRARMGTNLSVSYARPLHIVRGWMQHLIDADGRWYLDAVNNVAHVGHEHPRVVQAGQQQMAVLNTNTRYLHELVLRYAERLTATLPEPLRVCFFVNSGSEANELALRLARAYTQRPGVIVLDGAYHGNTTTLIEISPYKCEGPGGRGLAAYARKLPMPDVYRGPYRGADAAERYAAHVEAALAGLHAAGSPAGAFLCESLLSCGGQIVLPPGYLEAVYRRVRADGGVTIADEVQVGFGRVGTPFWGFETQNVVPDIVVMGKPAGNGHPLGIVVTTPEIARAFDNGMEFFSTFGGNPVSAAIGLAVLDVIEEESLQSNAHDVGAHLLRGLRELTTRHEAAGDARGLGLFVGLELVRDRERRTPFPECASYIANRLRDLGVLTSTDGPAHNVIKIKPPLCFTRADADRLVEALDRVLLEDACRLSG